MSLSIDEGSVALRFSVNKRLQLEEAIIVGSQRGPASPVFSAERLVKSPMRCPGRLLSAKLAPFFRHDPEKQH
ncbi:hypothetical protein [Microvirga brassicacearum]|uniref:hypothetical protein n=1 Tax=Microvirga brassicacearum TaxID=2580413 RepID=UPI0019113400|nr:hypothetical protein [Microvirga brassicacearum]